MIRALLKRMKDSVLGRGRGSIYLAPKFPEHAIGRQSYGGLTVLHYNSTNQLTIGNFCSFADDVTIFLGGEHRADWITTYPFNVLDKRFTDIEGHPHSKGDVVIGSDVWIARGAVILSGVRIGDGAVVGAYALVAKDVPDYGIVGGNPAQLLRMRFSDDAISHLKEIRWWEWPDARIERAVPYLQSDRIDEFVKLVRQGKL